MNNSIFTISLDFELHWGGFEKWPVANYQQYFANTRAVIPRMLDRFAKHDVHVTWATVGMLFHEDCLQLQSNFPKMQPSYQQQELSAYSYITSQGIGKTELSDPLHYADSLIRLILDTPNQELASHTFAHYYCNEPGQTLDQFRDDLRAAQRAAARYNRQLKSLVFPRNQFNEDYLLVCFEEGFTSVRDNPRDWFWNIRSTQNESYWKRLNRGLDAYFPIGKESTYKLESIEKRPGMPLCIPASRLLRPYNPKELFLNNLKISRICAEMDRAAANGEVYHLWWHPHNFGWYPEQSIQGLTRILTHYSDLNSRGQMQSLSMSEITQRRNSIK
ncbi:polysaccharide deacetylase [Chryseolinea sp. T2]|uniref:polysaccharide deacetylase family protein n=1 Tax=Chryseolinea sp. T2 TaxID=3129255 RepID=UPI003077D54D